MLGTPAFTWSPSAGAGFYTLTVSEHADLSDPVLTATALTGTEHRPPEQLEPGVTYSWRVTAVNAAGRASGAVSSFATRPLPTSPAVVDDFTGYADSAQLAAAYPGNPGGDPITPSLLPGQGMRLDYTLGGAGYAGVTRTFSPALDVWGQHGLELRLAQTGAPAKITVQFVTGGVSFEHTLDAAPDGVVRVPFTAFGHPSWAGAGPLDLTRFEQLSFYAGGGPGTGTLTVGQVTAYPAP
ncbi:hypothetical protein HCN51_55875 [Nonomuraea sp. FMUSA5-5]|uniref:Fibronectin type-III domain-containing protein n=1 Tax=Nonomuraea composti TaxID=2720023 RepID=A0ABX1BLK4_9ACTN|nr:hypothetical protein [Nonomuraea sp. FMUSA5-5]